MLAARSMRRAALCSARSATVRPSSAARLALCGGDAPAGLLSCARDHSYLGRPSSAPVSAWAPHLPHVCASRSLQCRWFSHAPEERSGRGTVKGHTDDRAANKEYMSRLWDSSSGVDVALEIFADIQHAEGAGMSAQVAFALIRTLAKEKRAGDCVQVLDFAEKHGARPWAKTYDIAIGCCSRTYDFKSVLHLFEVMRSNGHVPHDATYTSALHSANRLEQNKLALEIFDILRARQEKLAPKIYADAIRCTALVKGEEEACSLLRDVRTQGMALPLNGATRAIALGASKSGQWRLALDVLAAIQDCDDEGSVGKGKVASGQEIFGAARTRLFVYTSAVAVCSKTKRWSKVRVVYGSMPEDLREKLNSFAVGAVVMGHAQAKSNDLKLRALDIFRKRKADCNGFAYNGALIALRDTNQLNEVIELADEMTHRGIKWSPETYGHVVLAHIRLGSLDAAKKLMRDHPLPSYINCYRELIQVYGFKPEKTEEACALSLELLRLGPRVEPSDWQSALSLALQLPERAVYWEIREMMSSRGKSLEDEMPNDIMLERGGIDQGGAIEAATNRVNIYESALIGHGKTKRWDKVRVVYDSMPEDLREKLNSFAVGAVVMGHAQAKSNDLKLRALDIFRKRKADCNGFAHNAALMVLLSTSQLNEVIELADEMTHRGIKWSPETYGHVVLARIRLGSLDAAKKLMRDHPLPSYINCYRELIQVYFFEREDTEEACALSLELLRLGPRVGLSDWQLALSLALQLPERAVYWEIREMMSSLEESVEDEIPKRLMLAKD